MGAIFLKNITVIDGKGLDAHTVSAMNIDEDEANGFVAELDGFTIQGAQKSGGQMLDFSLKAVYYDTIDGEVR